MGQTVSTPLYELQNLIPAQTFSSTNFLFPSFSLPFDLTSSNPVCISRRIYRGKAWKVCKSKLYRNVSSRCVRTSLPSSPKKLLLRFLHFGVRSGKTGGCLTRGRRIYGRHPWLAWRTFVVLRMWWKFDQLEHVDEGVLWVVSSRYRTHYVLGYVLSLAGGYIGNFVAAK